MTPNFDHKTLSPPKLYTACILHMFDLLAALSAATRNLSLCATTIRGNNAMLRHRPIANWLESCGRMLYGLKAVQ